MHGPMNVKFTVTCLTPMTVVIYSGILLSPLPSLLAS